MCDQNNLRPEKPLTLIESLSKKAMTPVKELAKLYLGSDVNHIKNKETLVEIFTVHFKAEFIDPVQKNNDIYKHVVVELPVNFRENNTERPIYFTINDVIGDGNCGWYALAEQGFFDYTRLPKQYAEQLNTVIRRKKKSYESFHTIEKHRFCITELFKMYYIGFGKGKTRVQPDADFKNVINYHYAINNYLFSDVEGVTEKKEETEETEETGKKRKKKKTKEKDKETEKEEKSIVDLLTEGSLNDIRAVEKKVKSLIDYVAKDRTFAEVSLFSAMSYIFRRNITIVPTCGFDVMQRTIDLLKKIVVDKLNPKNMTVTSLEGSILDIEDIAHQLDEYFLSNSETSNVQNDNFVSFKKDTAFIAHVCDLYPFDHYLINCPKIEDADTTIEGGHFNILHYLSKEEADEKRGSCLFVKLYDKTQSIKDKDTCLTLLCKQRYKENNMKGTIDLSIINNEASENVMSSQSDVDKGSNTPSEATSEKTNESEPESLEDSSQGTQGNSQNVTTTTSIAAVALPSSKEKPVSTSRSQPSKAVPPDVLSLLLDAEDNDKNDKDDVNVPARVKEFVLTDVNIEQEMDFDFNVEEETSFQLPTTPVPLDAFSPPMPPNNPCSDHKVNNDQVSINVEAAQIATAGTSEEHKKGKKMANKTKVKEASTFSMNKYFVGEEDITCTHISEDDLHKYKYVIKRERNKKLEDIVRNDAKRKSTRTARSASRGTNLQSPSGESPSEEEESSLLSYVQMGALDRDIFSTQHLETYCTLLPQGRKSRSISKDHLKAKFIQNLMHDFGLRRNVLKYDEKKKIFRLLSVEEIYQFLLKKFTEKTTKARKEKSETRTNKKGGKCTTKNIDHPIHEQLKFGEIFYKDPKDQDEWFNMVMNASNPEKAEENVTKYTQEDQYLKDKAHSMFSVIHPLFEEYELIIYNGSHRLAYPKSDNEHTCVHERTRIKLVIPKPSDKNRMKTFFVIFDSRLVHAGSKARRESPLSDYYLTNFRLFHVAMQSYQGTKSKLSAEVNEEDKEGDYVDTYTRHDTIDHTTFEICNPYKCPLCNPFKEEEVIIDVQEEYAKLQELKRTTRSHRPKSYVCGDLDEHGWEVHVGVNYYTKTSSDSPKYKFFEFMVRALFDGPKTSWRNIVNNSGRSYHKLTDLVNTNDKQFLKSRQYILDVFYKDLEDIVRNIRGFHNYQSSGQLLLANRGVCDEQKPHRDFFKRTEREVSAASSRSIPARGTKRKVDSLDTNKSVRSTSGDKKQDTKIIAI